VCLVTDLVDLRRRRSDGSADHPGCNGLYAAALNQFFGPIASPSGNPNAAIGPGPFLSEGGAGEDIREDRAEACG
jgi:hypothetical protein